MLNTVEKVMMFLIVLGFDANINGTGNVVFDCFGIGGKNNGTGNDFVDFVRKAADK